MFVIKSYIVFINKKPILTKALTQFILFGTSDLICQLFEKRSCVKYKFDLTRIFKQAIFGFVFAPYCHFHFCKVIPFLFPAIHGQYSKHLIFKRMIYDQTIHAGFFTLVFYYYMGIMKGRKYNEIKEEIRIKFYPTMIDNWKVWPLAMLINYKYIPLMYSLLYTNIIGIFWLTYMSYLQNIKFTNNQEKIPDTRNSD